LLYTFGLIGIVVVAGYLIYQSGSGLEDDDMLPPLPEPIVEAAPAPVFYPESVDALLDDMDFGHIAFNVPEHLNIEDSTRVQLILSHKETVDELKRAITEEGLKEGAEIRVSEVMEADLTGPMFQITAITPEQQGVSKSRRTEWKWDVRPTEEGNHDLYLTLSAILEIEGDKVPRTIRSFEKKIVVKVTATQKAEAFVSENWQWLWAVVVVPVAGWFWNLKKRRSRGR